MTKAHLLIFAVLFTSLYGMIFAKADYMQLYVFSEDEAQEHHARCLDGSPYGYYFSPSLTEESSNKWLFWLESGGFCYDSLPYCSGDLHAGQRVTPNNETFGLYMTGHFNVKATLNDLRQNHGMGHSRKIVVSGTSAGGYGTFLNIDLFAEQFPIADVLGVPQAGLFFWPLTFPSWQTAFAESQQKHKQEDHSHANKHKIRHHSHPYSLAKLLSALSCEEDLNHPSAAMNTLADLSDLWHPYLHPSCVKDMDEGEEHKCLNVGNLVDYIKSPLFIVQAQYDSDQLFLHLASPAYTNPISEPLSEYMTYYRQCLLRIKNKVLAKDNHNSVFMPSCLTHTFAVHGTQAVMIDGKSMADVLDNYYNKRTPGLAMDSCVDVGCNPTCPSPSYTSALGTKKKEMESEFGLSDVVRLTEPRHESKKAKHHHHKNV